MGLRYLIENIQNNYLWCVVGYMFLSHTAEMQIILGKTIGEIKRYFLFVDGASSFWWLSNWQNDQFIALKYSIILNLSHEN